jgi:DNA-binding PadR family transcriptional regulator
MQPDRDPRRHLPLKPSAFAVLAALAEGPIPGIDILEAVNATVLGLPLFGPGTLYRLLRELRHERLIARVERATGTGDERHAVHELTPLGRSVLRAEAARLRKTLQLADRGSGGHRS